MSGTILITGANRGIGLALSHQFAKHGWTVLACCRRPEAATELIELARTPDRQVRILRLEVTDSRQREQLAAELRGMPIDILLNNAGVGGTDHQELGDVDEEAWIEAFRVNTIGPFRMAETFTHQVAMSDRRIIATIGSQMGSLRDNTSGGYYIYRSAKAAVHMVMRSLAVDLRRHGIICVLFHPGWVKTAMGGKDAPLRPEESAADLYELLLAITPEDSGRFLNHDGREIPW